MSIIEYPNRSQRKSQLARNSIALVSSLLSKRVKDSGRLARFTPRGLSRGSERVSNGNDACAWDGRAPSTCAYPLAIAGSSVAISHQISIRFRRSR